jgi:CRISPR-associated endonuclease/helicase Cas3
MLSDAHTMAWAKIRSSDGVRLPLIVHSVDVAECFRALVKAFPLSARSASADGFALSPVAQERFCVLALLHDVGKLNSGFQAKADAVPPPWKAGHVAEALYLLQYGPAAIHEALGLPEMLAWGPDFQALFRAAVAHHGRPAAADQAVKDNRIWQPYRDYAPLVAAQEIGAFLRAHYPLAFTPDGPLTATPAWQHHFAGLVALADQLGSRADRFPLDRGVTEDLVARSQERASRLLQDLRLDSQAVRQRLQAPDPATMFAWPAAAQPKPMQQALRDLPLEHRLVVLESETGSGKTEAALLRFQRLFAAGAVDALYFAVPTRAAASGLHARINQAVRTLFGEEAVLALPGYLKVGAAEGQALPDWQVLWDDDPGAELQAARWAAETPRRFLAALVAVGTVDQAMLAGLKVKWAHFRAAALSRALLVIDEVHASDRYMQAVLSRVVDTHVAQGGHALLMSATLGAAARAHWLGGARAKPVQEAPYPALSWREAGQERSQKLTHDGRSKVVQLRAEPWIADPETIAAQALQAARDGARVLVLRNTVRQAVAVQRAILARDPTAPVLRVQGVPAPHHGRFAAEDRRLLDAAVEGAFGKGAALGPAIAVGSQTLEQSLDLCADLLITDLCPVDVLLQRLGRLHRHVRTRPPGFETARCLVLLPEALAPGGGLTRFGLGANGEGQGIYPDMVGLEATRRLVAERPVWTIPAENRDLVEAGTDPATLDALSQSLGAAWQQERQRLKGQGSAQSQLGRLGLIDRSRGFDGRSELFPEDEAILTRLGGDRVLLSLPEGTTGPFGTPISQIVLPGHLTRSADLSGLPVVQAAEDGLRLQLGPVTLHYDANGVERRTGG